VLCVALYNVDVKCPLSLHVSDVIASHAGCEKFNSGSGVG
jgi:hypothetical protein